MILDTNALSAIATGEPSASRQFTHARQVALPAIVLGEYRFGIMMSRHHQDYERWLKDLLTVSVILTINEETAIRYAELRLQLKQAGTPIPSNDLWIAALSRQHSLPVLSRDRHFDVVKGLKRLDW